MPTVPLAQNSLGQVRSRPDQTPNQSFNTNIDQFGGAQARSLEQIAKGFQIFSTVADNLLLLNDKAAVIKAMNTSINQANADLLNKLYSQNSSQLFVGGKGPQQVYEDRSKVFKDVGSQVGIPLLNTNHQRNMFISQWGKFQATESKRMSSHIATQFRAYTNEVSANEVKASDEQIGQLAGNIEQDWKNKQFYQNIGHEGIDLRLMSPQDAVEQHLKWDDYANSAGVRGWFAAESNSLKASQSLASGKFEDEVAQEYWNALNPKQRKSLSGDLINRAQKLAQLQNDQRDDAVVVAEKQVQVKVNNFWVHNEPGQREQRIDIYDQIKNSPFVKDRVKKAMRGDLYGGSVTIDSEPGLVELEKAIRQGDITSFDEAGAFQYDDKIVATSETMRRRIFPLIKATQNERFTTAYEGGLAQLGIADTTAETSTVLRQRAATFKFRMLDWHQSDAADTEDSWKAAMRISKEIQGDIITDPTTMTFLRSMRARYEDALKTGDTTSAGIALKNIQSITNQLGIRMGDIK